MLKAIVQTVLAGVTAAAALTAHAGTFADLSVKSGCSFIETLQSINAQVMDSSFRMFGIH